MRGAEAAACGTTQKRGKRQSPVGTPVHSLGGVWVGPAWAMPLASSEGVGAFTQSSGEPWGKLNYCQDLIEFLWSPSGEPARLVEHCCILRQWGGQG